MRQGGADRAQQKQIQKLKRKSKEAFNDDDYDSDSDETFAFIAGYTEGGIPFGITHEEMAEYDLEEFGSSLPTHYGLDLEFMLEDNDGWFSDYFDWEVYFGDLKPVNDQEQLIDELNKLDSLSINMKK